MGIDTAHEGQMGIEVELARDFVSNLLSPLCGHTAVQPPCNDSRCFETCMSPCRMTTQSPYARLSFCNLFVSLSHLPIIYMTRILYVLYII